MGKRRPLPDNPLPRPTGRIALSLLVTLVSLWLAFSSPRAPIRFHARPQPPNIILISVDCLNARQLETARRRGHASNLSALTAESLVFTRAYAHAPWTTPSHMSMLTGLYPHEHGRDVPWRIMAATNASYDREPTHPTLATRLAQAGYETVAIVGRGATSGQYGLARGFSAFYETQRDAHNSDIEEAIGTLRRWLGQRTPRPFLLFLHTYDLHRPLPHGLARTRDALERLDAQIGVLLAELRRHHALTQALIVVTGDHGSQMTQVPGRCCTHGTGHYEENLRVPLVVRLPGATHRGRVDALARHIDILPTALAVAGLERGDYRGEGVSLLDVAAGRERIDHSFSAADGRCLNRYAVVTQRYKLILTPRDERQAALRRDPLFVDDSCRGACLALPPTEELFDLALDPQETNNLLRPGSTPTPEIHAVSQQLRALLARARARPPQYRKRADLASTVIQDPSVREALTTLRYLDPEMPDATPTPAQRPSP